MKPEVTPMPQTAGYRRLLLAHKAELLSELRKETRELIAQEEREDDLSISHYDFISQRIADLDYRELKPVAAALDRIERGTYGVCRECGCPIPEDVLCAAPWNECCGVCAPALSFAGAA